MKQTQLFTKTQKNSPHDEISLNAQLLIRAGFISKEMAGVYSFLPLGLKVLEKIIGIIREEMNAIGGQEVFLSSLQNPNLWKKTNRWNDEVVDVWFKSQIKNGKNVGFGTTHEEPLTNLVKNHITSYKDLPKYIYQFQNKFRNEKRAKSGIMRLREFIMKDLYSFHTDQKDLEDYYEKVKEVYLRIFQKMGLGNETFLTYASGGSFSRYSHEFQTLTSAGEDLIYICSQCHIAINKEIIVELKHKCPQCQNKNLQEKKAVEVGNIFQLGTKFSSALKLNYRDEKGNSQPVIMGCYGIGPARVMGTIAETKNDERGLIWPESIAPFSVHLIDIGKNPKSEKIYTLLLKNKIEVLHDDRNVSVGEKLADSDLIGIPYRIIVSQKSLASGGVEIKKRNEKESSIFKIENIIKFLKK